MPLDENDATNMTLKVQSGSVGTCPKLIIKDAASTGQFNMFVG